MAEMHRGGPFDVGDRVRLHAKFTDLSGQPADPDVVVCKVLPPEGPVDTLPVTTSTEVGSWHKDIDIDRSGQWIIRFEGTGVINAAGEIAVMVRKTVFYPT